MLLILAKKDLMDSLYYLTLNEDILGNKKKLQYSEFIALNKRKIDLLNQSDPVYYSLQLSLMSDNKDVILTTLSKRYFYQVQNVLSIFQEKNFVKLEKVFVTKNSLQSINDKDGLSFFKNFREIVNQIGVLDL